jgi:hypothetical protein
MDKDFEKAAKNLTPEDLDGGLHNIQVPQSFLDRAEIDAEEAAGFIIMNDDAGEIPYKVDGVNVTFTPEELLILTQVLEQFSSSSCCVVPYIDKELDKDLYEQQGMIRQLRDNINGTLEHYARVRPFTPFLIPWLRRTGKGKIRLGEE